MADSAMSILQREGEQRGAAGHIPDAEGFDEHVRFYRRAMRITQFVILFLVMLLSAMYFFLVR